MSCKRGASRGSYKIFLEDGSSFFLSADFFIEKRLSKGVVINSAQLDEIRQESFFVESYTKALSLLGKQPYTRINLEKKLLSKELNPHGIEKALAYLEKQGYINDETYAYNWVRGRIKNKLDSYSSLLSSLIQKGIKSSTARDVLDELYTLEVVDFIIDKSIKKYLDRRKGLEDIKKILLRKGFTIYQVKRHIDRDLLIKQEFE